MGYKEIDKEQFETMCGIQCTKLEICAVMKVDDKTLENWCKRTYKKGFSEVFKEKRQKGFASLRRMQYDKALKGNTTMLIFLGKNWLGQSDKQIIETRDSGQLDEFIEALKNLE